MGGTFARVLSESVKIKELKLRIAIEHHLRDNHLPPVPVSMVDPCLRAIHYAKREEWEHHIRLPKGVTYRGKKTAPVVAVIQNHHLGYFLEDE